MVFLKKGFWHALKSPPDFLPSISNKFHRESRPIFSNLTLEDSSSSSIQRTSGSILRGVTLINRDTGGGRRKTHPTPISPSHLDSPTFLKCIFYRCFPIHHLKYLFKDILDIYVPFSRFWRITVSEPRLSARLIQGRGSTQQQHGEGGTSIQESPH